MQIQQTALRVAAAASVTLFLVGGALGPAYATGETSGDTSSTHQSREGRAGHGDGNASTTGHSTDRQPESNADENDGGANAGDCDQSTDSGTTSESTDSTEPADSTQSTDDTRASDSTGSTDTNNYCSTRDGAQSQNGNGDGKATGEPCAGCVGKADNKNPPGQYPDGSDHNHGYECDDNKGIGKTNPAHTGCTWSRTASDEQPGMSCPEGADMAAEDCTSPTTCPQGSDMAQQDCVVPTTGTLGSGGQVLGSEAGATGSANRAPAEAAAASSGLLPETGAGRYGIPIAAGLALLGAGGALLLRKRSQTGS